MMCAGEVLLSTWALETTGVNWSGVRSRSTWPPDVQRPEKALTGRTEAFTRAARAAARSAAGYPLTCSASTIAAPVTMGVAMDVPLIMR